MDNPTADLGRDDGAEDRTTWSRRLLTPRWVAFTLLVVVAVGAFLFLAWWQLGRFESSSGSWQNLGYTLQWPFFAAFAVYLWWRLLRDAGRPPTDEQQPARTDRQEALAPTEEGVTSADALLPPLAPKESRPMGTPPGRQRATARASAPDEERDDPELAAYNAYLSALHRRSEESA